MIGLLPGAAIGEFRHPGLLHTLGDLERMKSIVAKGAEPWKGGFEKLEAHAQSQATYKMQGPFEEIGRNPTVHQRDFDQDANAAYQCALMWAITGEAVYARKSREIVDGWAATLKRISGRDAVLAASISPFKMVNAAEILRYTKSGWTEAKARRAGEMFARVIYPVIENFALFANGNWDTACIKTMMAIAVYNNDREMYERALRYYVDGAGDGRLTHYIYSSGQCQESGRDQSHTQLGLGHLGDAAEIAWNQGLDLYSYADNRLLRGFEYTARYNLGEEVPFAPDVDQTGKYRHEKISERGPFRPVYEEIYNHFAKRMGLAAPGLSGVIERIRPEGATFGADHPGFGTILFARAAGKDLWRGVPVAPGGMVATGDENAIRLSWIRSRGAVRYVVRRDGVVAGAAVTGGSFVDRHVTRGRVYRYTVNGSAAVRISAGLPEGWSHIGATNFDGKAFRIEGTVHREWDGDGTMTVRFVPEVASAFVRLGIAIGGVELALAAGENWTVALGDKKGVALGPRLTEPCWLRLVRSGDRVAGSFSLDGEHWTAAGETEVTLPRAVDIAMSVSSGISGVTSVVTFDSVSVTK